MRRTYRDLYAGGEQFKSRASEYLVRRQKEPGEVHAERVNRAFYENYIGSIIDWYAATLFRREPVLTFEEGSEASRRFFGMFAEDCDLKGTALTDFFRRQLVESLVHGRSYILVDFPRIKTPVTNRAEEDARGISRAYLVDFTADDLINWSYDDQGHLEWIVLRTSLLRQARLDSRGPVRETRWSYYDKQTFRTYRQVEEGNDKTDITLIDEGHHGLGRINTVPLFELRVSEGLWLMNKAALLQLEHFNKSNALSWALTMGLFAMPVVYSERPWSQIVGESYYIQLGPQDRFGWTEPEGHVYQIAADNLTRLKEEIYRVCYLLMQGGSLPGGIPQSGLSKQRDFAITQEVLRAYGDAVKDAMKRVLRTVAAARDDGVIIDVSGLDEFDIGDFTSELSDARELLSLDLGSVTFKRAVYKKLAFKYLCDVRQEVKDRIGREIDEWFDRQQA
jgi:hypothetical protein